METARMKRNIRTVDGVDCYPLINGLVRMREHLNRVSLGSKVEPIIYTDKDQWTVIEGLLESTTLGADEDLWARVWISSGDMFAHVYKRQSLFEADHPE
jgi:hypothetical protein